jgi:predicted nucleic acid-binding protein
VFIPRLRSACAQNAGCAPGSTIESHLKRGSQASGLTHNRWTVLRELGERRRARVEQWITGTSLGGNQDVARKWVQITAYSQLRGRPRPYDDSWIAAYAYAYDLPLATLNVMHFQDYAEHEGLTILTA